MKNKQEYNYAGLKVRTYASIIDLIFFISLLNFLSYLLLGDKLFDVYSSIFNGDYNTIFHHQLLGINFGVYIFFNNILPFLLVVAFWVRFRGTPGKLILGLEVLDEKTGKNISIYQGVVRYIGYLSSVIPLGFGFLLMEKNKRKQAWHDLMAETIVVYKK